MALINEDFRSMVNAVRNDEFDIFEREISDKHPVSCVYAKTKDSIMHVIAQYGRFKFLEAIINKFSAEDLQKLLQFPNADNKTPLHEVIKRNKYEIFTYLIP